MGPLNILGRRMNASIDAFNVDHHVDLRLSYARVRSGIGLS